MGNVHGFVKLKMVQLSSKTKNSHRCNNVKSLDYGGDLLESNGWLVAEKSQI